MEHSNLKCVMKRLMKNVAFAAVALTAVLSSCTKESAPDVVSPASFTVDFIASGLDSKTVFGTPDNGIHPVLWTASQKVALFYNSQTGDQGWSDGAQYVTPTLSEDGLTASFSATFSKDESDSHSFFAFSPLKSLTWMGNEDWDGDGVNEKKVVYAELPADQIPHSGTCDETGQLLVSRADFTDYPENVRLVFTHLSAYGKIAGLELPAGAFPEESDDSEIKPGIVGVLLEANKPVSGQLFRNFDENKVLVNEKKAFKYIYLDVNNELKGQALADVFFACAPVQFGDGDFLKVTVYTTSDTWVKTITFSSEHPLSFSPGRISSFGISSDGFEKQ